MNFLFQQETVAKKAQTVQTTPKKVEIPEITNISDKVVQIGNKKWIDRYKFDYALDTKPGGGGWIYNKAKTDMGATEFGAALVLAFACEEGGWGKGNDQSNTHNMFSLLSKNAKSKVGTKHGNVITYESWDEGFAAFKSLIDTKYSTFNALLKKDSVSADDINLALSSGNHHKQGGYTDSDKGKAITGLLKYVIVFVNHDITQRIKDLEKEIVSLEKSAEPKPLVPIFLNDFPSNPNQAKINMMKSTVTSLKNESAKLAISYGKL